ncbi:hypothetical protein B0H13DRAFT_1907751 [Mycena leptocephala]|nr:hypothetical protein B0H13DRAFT_1907751 [Mycena leptocephala]
MYQIVGGNRSEISDGGTTSGTSTNFPPLSTLRGGDLDLFPFLDFTSSSTFFILELGVIRATGREKEEDTSQTHNLGAVGPNAESAPRVLAREVRDQRARPSVLSKNINKHAPDRETRSAADGDVEGRPGIPKPLRSNLLGPSGMVQGRAEDFIPYMCPQVTRGQLLRQRGLAHLPSSRNTGPPIHVRRPRRARQAPPKVPACGPSDSQSPHSARTHASSDPRSRCRRDIRDRRAEESQSGGDGARVVLPRAQPAVRRLPERRPLVSERKQDRLGLLSGSAQPSPKLSLSALQHRASSLSLSMSHLRTRHSCRTLGRGLVGLAFGGRVGALERPLPNTRVWLRGVQRVWGMVDSGRAVGDIEGEGGGVLNRLQSGFVGLSARGDVRGARTSGFEGRSGQGGSRCGRGYSNACGRAFWGPARVGSRCRRVGISFRACVRDSRGAAAGGWSRCGWAGTSSRTAAFGLRGVRGIVGRALHFIPNAGVRDSKGAGGGTSKGRAGVPKRLQSGFIERRRPAGTGVVAARAGGALIPNAHIRASRRAAGVGDGRGAVRRPQKPVVGLSGAQRVQGWSINGEMTERHPDARVRTSRGAAGGPTSRGREGGLNCLRSGFVGSSRREDGRWWWPKSQQEPGRRERRRRRELAAITRIRDPIEQCLAHIATARHKDHGGELYTLFRVVGVDKLEVKAGTRSIQTIGPFNASRARRPPSYPTNARGAASSTGNFISTRRQGGLTCNQPMAGPRFWDNDDANEREGRTFWQALYNRDEVYGTTALTLERQQSLSSRSLWLHPQWRRPSAHEQQTVCRRVAARLRTSGSPSADERRIICGRAADDPPLVRRPNFSCTEMRYETRDFGVHFSAPEILSFSRTFSIPKR